MFFLHSEFSLLVNKNFSVKSLSFSISCYLYYLSSEVFLTCIHLFVECHFCICRTELVLSGLKDDVYKASESVADILQDYKAALTCAEYVVWQYRDPWSSDMVDFPLRISSIIESKYKVRKLQNIFVL